ncbi:hypothetical protein, partial [Mesorhizobium sp. M7A.F.Ca.MR.148.00.0.0]|uniref:hypothetical protein n=1 Tax=Mesorhizobium sp. M7A.F.Ca.MR.148.00.0.0 TaxID=2496775 RepID=UPI0019D0B0E4
LGRCSYVPAFAKIAQPRTPMQGASVRVAGGISAAEIVLRIVIPIVIQIGPWSRKNIIKT